MPRPNARPGPADAHAGPHERILELSNGLRREHLGGLLGLRRLDYDPAHDGEGTLRVELYRLAPGVKVSVSRDNAGSNTFGLSQEFRDGLRGYRAQLADDPVIAGSAHDTAHELLRLAAALVGLLDGHAPTVDPAAPTE